MNKEEQDIFNESIDVAQKILSYGVPTSLVSKFERLTIRVHYINIGGLE